MAKKAVLEQIPGSKTTSTTKKHTNYSSYPTFRQRLGRFKADTSEHSQAATKQATDNRAELRTGEPGPVQAEAVQFHEDFRAHLEGQPGDEVLRHR